MDPGQIVPPDRARGDQAAQLGPVEIVSLADIRLEPVLGRGQFYRGCCARSMPTSASR